MTTSYHATATDPRAPAPAATIAPADWQLVPVEPTEAMYTAANREWDGRMSARACGVWQAMLAAAPIAPKASEGETVWDEHLHMWVLAPAAQGGAEEEAERPVLTDAMRDAYYDLIPIAPGTETWAMAGIPSADKVWEAMTSACAAWQREHAAPALTSSERAEVLAVIDDAVVKLRMYGSLYRDFLKKANDLAARLRSPALAAPADAGKGG